MYLRCHYEYCTDQLDASFAKLATTDPDAIHYMDFRLALQETATSMYGGPTRYTYIYDI